MRFREKLYSQADMQRKCGVPSGAWYMHLNEGLIPCPSHYVGKRAYYTEADAKRIKRHFAKRRTLQQACGLISISEAARLAGIPYARIVHDRDLPRATHLRGQRRYYVPSDIAKLKKAWQQLQLKPKNTTLRAAKAAGYLSGNDASKALNMPHITFSLWQRLGKLPKPSRKVKGLRQPMYHAQDIATLRKLLEMHGYKPMRESVQNAAN